MGRKANLIPFNGEALTATEWSRRLGIPYNTIVSRARRGKPLDQRERTQHKKPLHTPGVAATRHPLYKTWHRMRDRCRDKKRGSYGGRGIMIAAAWDDFWQFVKDVGPKPSPKHTLDRINNDGNYEPGNVRWLLHRENCRNRRTCHLVHWDGREWTIADLADHLGLTYMELWSRAHWYKYDMVKTRASVEKLLRQKAA
jgi:hypothetical protein